MLMQHYNRDIEQTFEFRENCTGTHEKLTAKQSALLSDMMYDVFPFASRAIDDIAHLVGTGKIVSIEPGDVSPEDLERLNLLAQELPILSEFQPNEPHEYGINALIYRLSRASLIHGMGIVQDRYLNNSLNSYQGVLIFNPANFDFLQQNANEGYKLFYNNNQKVTPNAFFEYVGFEFRENDPWAYPLLSGGRFFTRLVLAAFVAILNISLRKGAPVQFSIIGSKNDDAYRDESNKDAYKELIPKLKVAMKSGLELSSKGVATNHVSAIPADLNLLSHTFGSDMVDELDPQLLDRILAQAANIIGIPPELVGVVLGGAGFSPERFKMMFRLFMPKVTRLAGGVCPVAWHRLLNFYRAKNENPALLERVKLVVERPDTSDPKENAEIEKMQAETAGILTKAISEISVTIGPEEARQFAIDKGIIQE